MYCRKLPDQKASEDDVTCWKRKEVFLLQEMQYWKMVIEKLVIWSEYWAKKHAKVCPISIFGVNHTRKEVDELIKKHCLKHPMEGKRGVMDKFLWRFCQFDANEHMAFTFLDSLMTDEWEETVKELKDEL